MKANQARFPIATMCRVLGVSPAGYYAWRDREPSRRRRDDEDLVERIRSIHQESRGIYGRPRIHVDLQTQGVRIGGKRIGRLMREAGVCGVSRRKWITTTTADGTRPAPDLVQRRFSASTPNALWLADITFVPTWEGFLYLAGQGENGRRFMHA